jgi:hypothetical protein
MINGQMLNDDGERHTQDHSSKCQAGLFQVVGMQDKTMQDQLWWVMDPHHDHIQIAS